MPDEPEVLGVCVLCFKDVLEPPPDEEHGATYEFDHEDKEDVLYHWVCIDPVAIKGAIAQRAAAQQK